MRRGQDLPSGLVRGPATWPLSWTWLQMWRREELLYGGQLVGTSTKHSRGRGVPAPGVEDVELSCDMQSRAQTTVTFAPKIGHVLPS